MYNVVQYSIKSTGGYKGNTLVWLIVVHYLAACNGMIFNQCPRDGFSASIGKYGYYVAYSAPVECKTGKNNRQLEKNYRLIFGE